MKPTRLPLAIALVLSSASPSALCSAPPDSSGAGPCGNVGSSDPADCSSDCEEEQEPHASVGSDCESNTINSFNGNAHRIITDLRIHGSVGRTPLKFVRHSNTRLSGRNLVHSSFGAESPWSHNYEWVMRDDGGTETQPIIKITFPNGKERRFRKNATTNIWGPATPYKNPDRIVSNGDDFTLHTIALEEYRFKRRYHSQTGGVFYRLESIRDADANITTIDYLDGDDTRIRQITDAADHWIKLHYRDESIRAADSTRLNPQSLGAQNGAWQEIHLTPGEEFRMLVFYQGQEPGPLLTPSVRELEFYDENNVQITGTIFGSSPWSGLHQPSRAFDGNTNTFYQYAHRFGGFVGIDLGAGNTTQVSRIRFAIGGAMNPDAAFLGLKNELVPQTVLSHVEGSDGREVHYQYDVHTEDDGIFQWLTLATVTYPDDAAASYSYTNIHLHTNPLLETASDPRYDGRVKQVRYQYALNNIIGFIRDEYDDATGQLLVSLRWDGPNDPKFMYPNGKVSRFYFWGGNARRATDSFGAVSEYNYLDGMVTSYKDPLGRVTTYGRRADRKLMTITTPGGSVTSYTRDTLGHITSVTRNGKTTSYILDPATKRRTRTNHPDGSFEEWSYNTFGQKLTHRLRNGTVQSWTYNAAGLKTSHTSPAGVLTTYTHDTLNRLESETRHLDANTTFTTSYEYNDRAQITKMIHADGSFIEHMYDDFGNRVATLDERGSLTLRTFDSLGRLLAETSASGTVNARTTTFNYTSGLGGGCGCNTGDRPVTITHPDGTVTLNTYDAEWRLVATTQAFGTPEAATTGFTYDLAGQRTSMIDPLGRITTYTYDLDGRVTTEIQASGTPVALTTTRAYNLDGNVVSTTQGAGGPAAVTITMGYDVMERVVTTTAAAGTPAAATTTRTYNNLGQLVATTDPLGRITTYSYDSAGRALDTILPDGTTRRTIYDGLSRPIQTIDAFGHPEQAVTSVSYDNRDRIITRTDPTGITTTTTYDAGGLQVAAMLPSGKSVEYHYDENRNLTHVVTAPGTPEETVTLTIYDNRNRPVTLTDGEGSVTTTAYDALGRTVAVTDDLGNTTTYTYDLVGNALVTTAADGVVVSTRTYDALNRLTSDKDGKNQTITYHYDALGRRTAYTDAKGATFSFQYDVLGRLTRRTEPDGTFQTYTHDVLGRLLVHTKADFKTKTHHYENPHRDFLTKITYSNGESPRLMSYDRLGRLLSAANAASTITRTYDPAGRQLSETQALTGGPTGTFGYQYDTDGNLQRHIRPDGSFIDYQYNDRNLLGSVISDAPPPVATYTYNGRNQIEETVIENGLFTAMRAFDDAGRLLGITHAGLQKQQATH